MLKYTLAYFITLTPSGYALILGHQKRGLWEGYYNGFGGKVEKNEASDVCILREVYEETGIHIPEKNLEWVAQINFIHNHQPNLDCQLTVYFMPIAGIVIQNPAITNYKHYSLVLKETADMIPAIFPFDAIPYNRMPPTDVHWLPKALDNYQKKGYTEHVFCKIIGQQKYGNNPRFVVQKIDFTRL